MMRAREGFALMASLWLVVAISVLALQISHGARDRRLAGINAVEEQQAHAAAASGIEHARARLARVADEGGDRRSWRDPQRVVDPWYALDTLLQAEMGRLRYQVRLHDVSGRLNVNRATAAELRRYFTGLRVDARHVETLVDGILDWIDADDARRTHGAELSEYLRYGARDLPRNAPIDRVEELRGVRGMTSDLWQYVEKDFTTLGTGQINVNSASRSVLLSLPGFTEAAADAAVREQKNRNRIGSWTELLAIVPSQVRAPFESASSELAMRLAYQTREVGVESSGTLDGSPVVVVTDAMLVRAGSTVFVTWSSTR